MRYAQLGDRGPLLSAVGYGSWEFGGRVDRPARAPEQCRAALTAALESGVNWVDTGELYGAGRSERIVGEVVRAWPGEVIVVSKVAPLASSSGSGFEPWQVRRGVERMLTRMRRDHVDVVLLHWPDPGVPLAETWAALAILVDEGKVRFIGLSNFPRELAAYCHDLRSVDCVQVRFSLLDRGHRALLAWAAAHGIGAVTYASLGYGILTGTRLSSPHDEGSDLYADLFAAERFAANLELVRGLGTVAAELGCTVGQLALAWAAAQTGVTSALFGSTDPEHVRENAAAGELALPSSVLTRIERLL